MSDSCINKNPLKHSGTSQEERFLDALDPAQVELHGLSESDWMKFAYHYARQVNFFKDQPDLPDGDWQSFFPPESEVIKVLNKYGSGEAEPHLALFLSFLKLLTYPQNSLNRLPQLHLDFYYKQVLAFKKKPLQPDKVHVLFELAKNAANQLLEEGTLLDAGKDPDGNPLIYKTVSPLAANHAAVASLKSVFVEQKEDGTEILRHAPATNTLNGVDEEPEEGQHWPAFGNTIWPEVELGFFVTSGLLFLQEGVRTISIQCKVNPGISIPKNRIKAFVTTEDEWLEISSITTNKTTSAFNFIIELVLGRDMAPVTAYDEDVHEASLNTKSPALKIVFTRPEDYQTLKNTRVESMRLNVQVQGAEKLELKNELGNIDPEKPFMPFGSRPKIGSRLSINYPEMAGKPVSNLQLGMQWLNTPANFSIHYSHYEDAIEEQKELYANNTQNLGSYFAIMNYKDDAKFQNEFANTKMFFLLITDAQPPDEMKETFNARIESPYNSSAVDFKLFSDLPQVNVNTSGSPIKVSDSRFSMILTDSFYHDLYPKLYVNAVLAANDSADLPNEPYTPLLDTLTLNYTAFENVDMSAQPGQNTTMMFHQHPFGTKRAGGSEPNLLPDYNYQELYIGLENMVAGSNISLLFQVASGTEDSQKSRFEEGEIDWWALSDNEWIKIGDDSFARNDVNHFLRPGIVELAFPARGNSENSLLSRNLHWLRIRLKKEPEAVCNFIGVHTQAALAVLDESGEQVDRASHILPEESIGKMINPRASVKTVFQPYSGFGGEPEESAPAFYRRVSERLRHKNRAVTIWDYERLLLEKFPILYKVKCLNHSFWDENKLDEMSPGHATVVLIPKISEDNTRFRLEPKVSRDVLEQVEQFINHQNSIHADIRAANPVYEPVRFEFNVKFNQGLDFNLHKKKIRDDVKRLMAPWVFDTGAAIEFGESFSAYQVVHYLENLSYVNHITDFRMYHKPLNGGYVQKQIVEPSVALGILIPVFDETAIGESQKCD